MAVLSKAYFASGDAARGLAVEWAVRGIVSRVVGRDDCKSFLHPSRFMRWSSWFIRACFCL